MKVWEMIERLTEVDASLDIMIDADDVKCFSGIWLYDVDRLVVETNDDTGNEVVIIRI